MAPAGKGQRERVLRVHRKRLAQQIERPCARLLFEHPDVRHRAHGVVVRAKVLRPLAARALDLGKSDRRLQRPCNPLGDLVLQVKDVLERAINAIGPDVRAAGRIDQLHGDAQAVSRLLHAAFQHVAHAELATDLLHVDCLSLVDEGRVACDDEEGTDTRQGRSDRFDHAVSEIFLLGIARHVVER